MSHLEDSLHRELKKFKTLQSSLEKVLTPILDSQSLDDKQVLEVCQLGKFLAIINNNASIFKRSESPDFIIEFQLRKIGVEHERILNPNRVKQFQSVKKLFDDAAKQFEKKYPDLKVLANFHLVTDNFSFTKSERQFLIDNICNYVFCFTNNIHAEKPYFINRVRISNHTLVAFNYLENNFEGKGLQSDELLKAINRKDKLIDDYKLNSGLEEQWLLLVIGSLSSDSYNIERLSDVKIESRFDRIYLLEDFNANVYRIK